MKLFSACLFLLLLSAPSVAGQIFIFVADRKDCQPPKKGMEYSTFTMTSPETRAILDRYFKGTEENAQYKAAIVNAGLRFCSKREQYEIFDWMLKQLDQPNPSKTTWEVIRNYQILPVFKHQLMLLRTQKVLSPDLAKNLEKLPE